MKGASSAAVPGSCQPLTFGQLLLTAAWLGAASGLLQVLGRGIQRLFPHLAQLLGPHFIWMAPLSTATLITGGAILIAGASLLVIRRWRFGFQFFCLALPGIWSVTLLFPSLDDRAGLVLAAGIAVQLARIAAARRERLIRMVRWQVPAVAGILGIIGLGIGAWHAVVERRLLARLPAGSARTPNVLLLVVDTERAMSLSLYGRQRPTSPWLDQFARSATVFDRAMAPASWTLPSHASMFMGRYAHELSLEPKYNLAYPTLAEHLTSLGYATAAFVANALYLAPERGLDRGFAHYEAFAITPEEILINSTLGLRIVNADKVRRWVHGFDVVGRRQADDINGALLSWLDRNRSRPFFAFVNYYDAHPPYLPPSPFDTAFGADPHRDQRDLIHGFRGADHWKRLSTNSPPEVVSAELNAYEAGISYVDHQLEQLVDALLRRGVLNQTLVIITADHGESFGETHRVFRHGTSLYASQVWVPLLLRLPGAVPSGERISQPVSLRDLGATILDLLRAHPARAFPGLSLARTWQAAPSDPTGYSGPVISALGRSREPLYSLTRFPFYYIRTVAREHVATTIREELYDLGLDPMTTHDLAGSDRGRATLPGLRALLDSVLAANPPAKRSGKSPDGM